MNEGHPPFARGQRVRIIQGEFTGEIGRIDKQPDEFPHVGLAEVELERINVRGLFRTDAMEAADDC